MAVDALAMSVFMGDLLQVERLNGAETLRSHAGPCQGHGPAWRRARHTSTIGAPRLPRPLIMRPALLACGLSMFALNAVAAPLPSPADLAAVAAEVKAAEIAFAKTMADRRLDQFTDFVADDAVFNGATPHIGRAAVVDAWKSLFKAPQAPFSWAPDAVAPSADGRTAISTGLARDPAGKIVSRFTSIWRKDADGHWRVIVDQGVDACDCPPEKK